MSIFKPNQILNKYTDFDIKMYREALYDTILIDIDNTIDIPDSPNPGSKEAFEFLENLTNNGFKVIILSNNTKERVLRFLNGKDIPYNEFSLKPLPFSYLKVIKKYHLDKDKVIVFGDQILTDTLGGNLLGLYTIYVKPLINKDIIKTKFNRFLERLIFKYILHEKV